MKIDYDLFIEKLQTLTGANFEDCERAERNAGNMTPVISFSAGFQCRLAALALGTNPHEIKDLPAPEYNRVVTTVANFLFSTLANVSTD